MKIQISPIRKVEDAMLIWHEGVNDVDLVMDPRPPYGLKFRPGTVKDLYAFEVLGITKVASVQEMVTGWFNLLAPGGTVYIVENDFEYIARAVTGGDLTIEEFNREFVQKSYMTRELIVDIFSKAGFPDGSQRMWSHDGIKIPVAKHQIIISATKQK